MTGYNPIKFSFYLQVSWLLCRKHVESPSCGYSSSCLLTRVIKHLELQKTQKFDRFGKLKTTLVISRETCWQIILLAPNLTFFFQNKIEPYIFPAIGITTANASTMLSTTYQAGLPVGRGEQTLRTVPLCSAVIPVSADDFPIISSAERNEFIRANWSSLVQPQTELCSEI